MISVSFQTVQDGKILDIELDVVPSVGHMVKIESTAYSVQSIMWTYQTHPKHIGVGCSIIIEQNPAI